VAVCTCLIVVAVANATATPKAIVSAIKTNFGPITRHPFPSPPGRHMGSRRADSNPHRETDPPARSPFLPSYSLSELFRASLSDGAFSKKKTPGSILTNARTNSARRPLAARNPFKNFLNLIGTDAAAPSYCTRAKSCAG
jgi:hypothetical protein